MSDRGLRGLLAGVRRDVGAVEDDPWARGAARAGYVAQALLLIGIGVLALAIALQHRGGQPDASGAFGAIARVPGGTVLLAVVAAGEWALGAQLVVAGVLHRGRRLEDWRRRVVVWGRAPVYLVIGTIALRFALGAHENGAQAERASSRHLLDVPGGAVALALIGAVVAVAGASFVWIGAFRRFTRTIRLPHRALLRRAVLAAGVAGYIARGVTFCVVGVLVIVAAVTLDASKAAGLDAGLGGFAGSAPGRVALVAIALGWIAAGAYTVARSVLARLR